MGIAEPGLAKTTISKACSIKASECLHAVKENMMEVLVSTVCQHTNIGRNLLGESVDIE